MTGMFLLYTWFNLNTLALKTDRIKSRKVFSTAFTRTKHNRINCFVVSPVRMWMFANLKSSFQHRAYILPNKNLQVLIWPVLSSLFVCRSSCFLLFLSLTYTPLSQTSISCFCSSHLFFFLKEISCSSLLLSLLIIPFPCPLLLYLGYFPRDSVSYKLLISLWATDIQMYVFSRSKACSIIKKKKAYTRFLGMIRCVEFMKYLKTAPLTFHVGWRETEHGDETVIWRMHKRDYEEE